MDIAYNSNAAPLLEWLPACPSVDYISSDVEIMNLPCCMVNADFTLHYKCAHPWIISLEMLRL